MWLLMFLSIAINLFELHETMLSTVYIDQFTTWFRKLVQFLKTHRRTEYLNTEMGNCYTLFIIPQSPKTSLAPWTNGLVEVQTKILEPIWYCFYILTSENWPIQVEFIAYAHNAETLSHLHVSLYEIVFHTQPSIPHIFKINPSPNQVRECTAQNCSNFSPHSYH